jgi:hypothetical protein
MKISYKKCMYIYFWGKLFKKNEEKLWEANFHWRAADHSANVSHIPTSRQKLLGFDLTSVGFQGPIKIS